MTSLVNPFLPEVNPNNFDGIKISVASPEKILSWSSGEVKKPETINYRTFKPERDGLFCARIFGPVKDYECLCGKYKRMKYKGIVCEKCGVEVTLSKIRRERMGHIDLATPIAHIWFLKSLPSRISLMLDITLKELEKVLYFESYIVVDSGITTLTNNQILNETEYMDAINQFGEDSFRAGMGAEAVREIMIGVDLEAMQLEIREQISKTASDSRYKKLVKRLKLVESFLNAKLRPEWMILTVLPVISPELRPLVPLDGGRFATSDLNDLYRRVINRNNRLKRLMELSAPEIIIRNEKRMLQESVDALFDNGRRGRPITGTNRRPLKSVSDLLKGKQGRFRQNLLGKRVDYSGRSVITVGPYLKLHECGLPKKMAIELFKPFIYSKLEAYGISNTIKVAKRMVEEERPEVWDILEEVIKEHPILLNRAPTLHRLGIQAFEPKLIEGKAIHLHPLVCTAFNADFDGDQMAVHVPLSLEAQLEARVLMMSTNNILSPANGRPIIVPSQDIILGLYYTSIERDGELGEGKIFSDFSEVEHALLEKSVSLHAKIICRFEQIKEDGTYELIRVNTTPGRLIVAQALPKSPLIKFDLINKLLTKKEISNIIDTVYRYCGQKDTVIFADAVTQIGFNAACKAGISVGKDDLVVPQSKKTLVAKTDSKVKEYEVQFQDGLITRGEKYNKVIDAWSQCTEQIASEMMKEISKSTPGKPINSVYMMAHSGARGSAAQMKQLAGMRGLMAKPSGEIIESPIISNFKEGLTALEYFNSTHGARKGLADTALKTANSGYLTRRLVDVAQDCTVVSEDCGTSRSIDVHSVVEGGDIIASISERILGRVIAHDIIDPLTGEVVIPANTLIDESMLPSLETAGIESAKVFSPLTCSEEFGVCAKCYGRDLARGKLVNLGEAVGIIAAQSIGEPGTQLTMRTFHIGGAAQRSTEKNSIEAPVDGTVQLRNCSIATNSQGNLVVMTRNGEISIRDSRRQERFRNRVPFGARLYVQDGASITANTKIAEWDAFTTPIISETAGIVQYADLQNVMTERTDETTGVATKVVSDWKQLSSSAYLNPRISILDSSGKIVVLQKGNEANYSVEPNSFILVNQGQQVQPGDILARVPRETAKTRDITGGLPRVAELFESRRAKDFAVITDISGIVEYGKDQKSKRRVIIRSNENKDVAVEYVLPREKQILVYEGDFVERGAPLTEGDILPHDILRVNGVEALSDYMVNEVQAVYRLQGVLINDKHIEVIVRQMLQKVEITHGGDTHYLIGKEVDYREVNKVNDKVIASKGKPASFIPILQGITKASLQTDSFISSASFQETTRILTQAAVEGKEDRLIGIKENVIVGRLIPAGTGRLVHQYRLEAERLTKLEAEKAAKTK